MQPKIAKTEHLEPIQHKEIFKTSQNTADLKYKNFKYFQNYLIGAQIDDLLE